MNEDLAIKIYNIFITSYFSIGGGLFIGEGADGEAQVGLNILL